MIVIVGHGPSVLSGLGALIDTHPVVRLKRGLLDGYDRSHWGSRTDYLCARSPSFDKGQHPFWLFDSPEWCEYYARYSDRKPSTGLCALFMAVEKLKPDCIGLIGFDRMLNPDDAKSRKWNEPKARSLWGHDQRAEHDCLHSLGVAIVDLTRC